MKNKYLWHNKLRFVKICLQIARDGGYQYSVAQAANDYVNLTNYGDKAAVSETAQEAWDYMHNCNSRDILIEEKLDQIERLAKDIRNIMED